MEEVCVLQKENKIKVENIIELNKYNSEIKERLENIEKINEDLKDQMEKKDFNEEEWNSIRSELGISNHRSLNVSIESDACDVEFSKEPAVKNHIKSQHRGDDAK